MTICRLVDNTFKAKYILHNSHKNDILCIWIEFRSKFEKKGLSEKLKWIFVKSIPGVDFMKQVCPELTDKT
jgi:hypothetical protein